jgi:hypothetical protein
MKPIFKSALMASIIAMGLGLSACDSKKENAAEDQAGEVRASTDATADAMEATADAMVDASASAIDSKAEAVRGAGEAKADAMEDKADKM